MPKLVNLDENDHMDVSLPIPAGSRRRTDSLGARCGELLSLRYPEHYPPLCYS